ncbi:MAG: hypothetical protein PWP23_3073 [Candidatus Sumerlaeota bacterium]|nr:hypothetical protein [Candidatus Sumerlaeota bacterium]
MLSVAAVLACVARPGAGAPVLPHAWETDANENRIGDALDARLAALRRARALPSPEMEEYAARLASESVAIEAVFTEPPTPEQRAAFTSAGGTITFEFAHVSHGWLGSIALENVERVAAEMGTTLFVLALERPADVTRIGPDAKSGTESWSAAQLEGLWGSTRIVLLGEANPLALAKGVTLKESGVPVFLAQDADFARAMAALSGRGDPEQARALLLAARTSEGFDAAAATEALNAAWRPPVRGAFGESEERNLFVRPLDLKAGRLEFLRLEVPPEGDFDLEVVRVPPAAPPTGSLADRLRVPELGTESLASSTRRAPGVAESVSFTPEEDGRAWLRVVRVHGAGMFRVLAGAPPTPPPTPVVASEPEARPTPAPVVQPAVVEGRPLDETAIVIDGIGDDLGVPVAQNANPPSGSGRLSAVRLGHDNDFLYLHAEAHFPAERGETPCALWIIGDGVPHFGDNVLGDYPSDPFALPGVPGLAGTVLEPAMTADTILLAECAAPEEGVVRLGVVDCLRGAAEAWGELWREGDGWRFVPGAQMPVEFAAALGPDGLEMRIPLSALGLEAPLFPGTPRQEWRFLAGMGDAATGEWSNQILPPVDKDQSLGRAPDFAANTSATGSFSGVQAVAYGIEHVE